MSLRGSRCRVRAGVLDACINPQAPGSQRLDCLAPLVQQVCLCAGVLPIWGFTKERVPFQRCLEGGSSKLRCCCLFFLYTQNPKPPSQTSNSSKGSYTCETRISHARACFYSICACMYVRRYVCICMYVSMYVCMCLCTYTNRLMKQICIP